MSTNPEIFPGIPYDLAESYIEDVSTLPYVKAVIVATSEDHGPTIVTVISARPGEVSYRRAVYETEGRLLDLIPRDRPYLSPYFRLYNLQELIGGELSLEKHLSNEFGPRYKIIYNR